VKLFYFFTLADILTLRNHCISFVCRQGNVSVFIRVEIMVNRSLRASLCGFAALVYIASPAESAQFYFDGRNYELQTVEGTFNDLEGTLSNQLWWRTGLQGEILKDVWGCDDSGKNCSNLDSVFPGVNNDHIYPDFFPWQVGILFAFDEITTEAQANAIGATFQPGDPQIYGYGVYKDIPLHWAIAKQVPEPISVFCFLIVGAVAGWKVRLSDKG
jgi:hypothetical protein